MTDLDTLLSGKGEAAPAPETPTEQPASGQSPPPVEAEQPTPEAEGDELGGHQKTVPLAALHAEKQKAKRYTEQVAEFQTTVEGLKQQNSHLTQQVSQLVAALQKQQPQEQRPDFWAEPENAVQHHIQQSIQPIQQTQTAIVEHFSRMLAVRDHGQEKVNEAFATMEKRLASDPSALGDYQRIMRSPDPWGELVSWHKKQAALEKYGADPEAYINAEIEKRLAAKQQEQPSVTMPSNLAGARNVGNRAGPVWSGPPTLTDIFKR